MGDPLTVTLNLTFLGTVGIGFVMFLFVFLMFVLTLIIAGVGRLAVLCATVLAGRSLRQEINSVAPLDEATERPPVIAGVKTKPAAAPAARSKEMAQDWVAAVAAADAREAEREKNLAGGKRPSAPVSGRTPLSEHFPEEQRKAS